MTHNWLELAVPYFVPVCRNMLDAYFAPHGFRVVDVNPAGRVTYSDGRSFVELSYWLEDAPEFVPMVVLGLDPRYLPASDMAFNRVGAWYAIPEDSGVRQYETWRFSNAEELEVALRRIRDEVINAHAKPLWLHPKRLSALIERRYREVIASNARELLEKKRSEAEAAFESKRYEQTLDIYRSIGIDNLTPVERKRFEIAAKRAGPSGPS